MNSETKALIFGLLAVLLWSTVASAFKIGLAHAHLLWLLTGSCFFSILGLACILVSRNQLLVACQLLWRYREPSIKAGLLNPVVYYLILFAAYASLPAQIAQPVNYTWGVVLPLLAAIFLGKKITRWDISGMCIAYSGVFIVAIAGESIVDELNYIGVALALLSSLVWSAYWLVGMGDQRSPVVALFQNFVYALPVLLLLLVVEQWLWQEVTFELSYTVLASMAYIGLFEMGLTFVLWQYALKTSQYTARISSLIFFSPFLSLFIIHLVLGEPLQWLTFSGLLVIVLGVGLQQVTSSKT